MLKAYRYRLIPTKAQEAELNQHFGNTRWLYNYALDLSNKHYAEHKKGLSRYDIQAMLPELKCKNEWLKKSNSQSLQVAIQNLEIAFKNFFKKKGKYPVFKKKVCGGSFGVPQNAKINFENNTVSIPKFKSIKAKLHRKFEGEIRQATVSKTATGKFYISFLVETSKLIPTKNPIDESKAVGIDVGIKDLVICSDGTKYQNPKWYRKAEKKLNRMNRWRSRKVKGSANRQKWNRKVAKQHEKISNQRKDMWHKISHELLSKYDTICVEDLAVKNMMQNRKLSKSISDAGWGMFFTMLKYKAGWQGKNILEIGRFEPSSKQCSICGATNNNLTLKDRTWTCENGHTLDRDTNAATNVKRFAFYKITTTEGISGSNACGDGTLVSSAKQEAHRSLADG
jgi:putative transposase